MASPMINAENNPFRENIGDFIEKEILNSEEFDDWFNLDWSNKYVDAQNDNYVPFVNPISSSGSESTANMGQFSDVRFPTFASNLNSFEADLNTTSPIDSEPNLPPANSISPQSTSNRSDHSNEGPTFTSILLNSEDPLPFTMTLPDSTIESALMNYIAGGTQQENEYAQSFIDTSSGEESPFSLGGPLYELASTDFSRNSQQVTERLQNPARIPADQPSSSGPQKLSQKVAQKVAQKEGPEVVKKRGPGRPRKNKVASQGTRKTTKKNPITSRKRQRSNNIQRQVEFGYPKLRELTLDKELGSAGTTPTPSSESSNSPPSNDIENFVSAPNPSVRILAPVVRKRRSTSDVSDNLPQTKRRRKQVETSQAPVDHLHSANTITAQHPNRKTNTRTTEKKREYF
ncbi:hypothetical protein TKK_0014320 [Trichogramma kaykai]|uniref:Ataxin-2 C-terminal domain-containing protein n=1 Tax=Trichogramma kaykai TaxID=54128 RepID=A0ABD2WF32_9HYME